LEKATVILDSRQAIKVNGFLQTSAAHIYAVGDVTDAPARVEMTAGHEGTLAAQNALTGPGEAAKPLVSSQRQPSRSIGEVFAAVGFARKIDDGREAN